MGEKAIEKWCDLRVGQELARELSKFMKTCRCYGE